MKYAGIDIGAETIKYAIYDTKTEKIEIGRASCRERV